MAKVIKLTNNNNETLIPISDSAYIQHIQDGVVTTVYDALNYAYSHGGSETTSYNIFGAANGMTNSAQTINGNVYLRHIEGTDGSYVATSTHNIIGAGLVEVKSDASGNVTISTNTSSGTVGISGLKYAIGSETNDFELSNITFGSASYIADLTGDTTFITP